MALSAGNAHFEHYYSQDLPSLIQILDDGILYKCKSRLNWIISRLQNLTCSFKDFLLSLIQSELSSLNQANEAISKIIQITDATSEDLSNSIFMQDPASNCLR